jgi:hypothetical protein
MRLSAGRIRSINRRIFQAEASAFPVFGRNTRHLSNSLKASVATPSIHAVHDVVLANAGLL